MSTTVRATPASLQVVCWDAWAAIANRYADGVAVAIALQITTVRLSRGMSATASIAVGVKLIRTSSMLNGVAHDHGVGLNPRHVEVISQR